MKLVFSIALAFIVCVPIAFGVGVWLSSVPDLRVGTTRPCRYAGLPAYWSLKATFGHDDFEMTIKDADVVNSGGGGLDPPHALHEAVIRFADRGMSFRAGTICVRQAGWPFRCVTGSVLWTPNAHWMLVPTLDYSSLLAPEAGSGFVVHRPQWIGLIANGVLYTGCVIVPALAFSMLRRWHRRTTGRCVKCGYLRAIGVAKCSECGECVAADAGGR